MAITRVNVGAAADDMSIDQWLNYYNKTGVLFTSSSSTDTVSAAQIAMYYAGCDPYKQKKEMNKDDKGRRLDIFGKLITPGQIIAGNDLFVGLVINFTKSGNPRVIPYDLGAELCRRDPGYLGQGLRKPVAMTEYNLLVIRKAHDLRTEIPKEIKSLLEG